MRAAAPSALRLRYDRVGRLAAAGAASLALLALGSAAAAEPAIRAKQRQAEAILAQVQELDRQVGLAAERFNGANYELGRLSTALRTARADLARSRGQLAVAQDRAGERLVDLYVNGSTPSLLEVLLGAESLDALVDRVDAAERLVVQDRRIVSEVRRLVERTQQRQRRIAAARARQGSLVARLGAERSAIGERLRERERLLASVRVEVERLAARERARQAELRRRAEAELARQRRLAAAQSARARSAPPTAPPGDPPPIEPVTAETAPQEPPATEAVAPPADASRRAQVVAIAMRYLGVPYKWGGASPSTGFDCSGFTMYVFAQIGVSLPHYAAAQYQLGTPVAKEELVPGDLVFFRGLGHMGMYIGAGNFIHAPQTGDVVKISSLSEPYRVANWVGARRVL